MRSNKERCFCNTCSYNTFHKLIERIDIAEDDEIGLDGQVISQSLDHFLLQCQGCGSVTLKIQPYSSEVDLSMHTEFYPPRVSRKRPSWFWKLPPAWWRLMNEIYHALNAEAKTLAMMGTRTLVDLYMTSTVGDCGSFQRKLQALVDNGYLAAKDVDVLNSALEAGSASAHRGFCPSDEHLAHAMDIVENLLQRHALADSAAALAAATPARRPTQ